MVRNLSDDFIFWGIFANSILRSPRSSLRLTFKCNFFQYLIVQIQHSTNFIRISNILTLNKNLAFYLIWHHKEAFETHELKKQISSWDFPHKVQKTNVISLNFFSWFSGKYGDSRKFYAPLWKYAILADPNVQELHFKEVDQILTDREVSAVKEWKENSDFPFLIMRDHKRHQQKISLN